MTIPHIIGAVAALILAVILLAAFVVFSFRCFRREGATFTLIAAAFLYAAGTKPDSPTRPVSFPYVDVEQRYLFDYGSIVSNDHVHVNFTASVVLPQSAPIYLDYSDGTNLNYWTTYTNATLATFPRPLDFYFPGAISNTWMCYTTWTPGPTVHTNGVAQVNWHLPTTQPFDSALAVFPRNTRILPIKDYDAEVEYLESTGTQWIDTGLKATAQDEHRIVCSLGLNQTSAPIYGAANTSTRATIRIILNGWWRFGGSRYYSNKNMDTNYRVYEIVASPTDFIIDGTTVAHWDTNGFDDNYSVSNIELFKVSGYAGIDQLRISAFQIKRGTTLVRDYIPVRVGTTGYLYDRVTGTLFGNQGTGAFLVGPDLQ